MMQCEAKLKQKIGLHRMRRTEEKINQMRVHRFVVCGGSTAALSTTTD